MANAKNVFLTPAELSTFCAQLTMILKAGIPVAEGLSIMQSDLHNTQGKQIIATILDHMQLGEPFHMALSASGLFPKYMVDLVEIGEQTGKLDEVMDYQCSYYEREESIARSLKSAITYPLILIIIMVLVIGILVAKVLPIFHQVFLQLGHEMSVVSQSILQFGNAAGRCSAVITAVFAAAAVLLFALSRTQHGKNALVSFQSRFFLTKTLYAKIAAGRFAGAMSMMLSSGLDPDESLDLAAKLIDNRYLSAKIEQCKKQIAQGSSFADALEQTELFSGVYAKMVSVGFQTGSVDTVMQKLSERYEQEIDDQISSLISLVEPTLVAVFSVIVGMILLSVMLPLMGIMSSIG